jgi:uncharacterized membrane protein YsdA (DUF1294 family)/cold shock CspA family protein
MRRLGRVSAWDDQRGFGFITPVDGGARVFVHVSALPRGRRPSVGDAVSFTEARDDRNRLRATGVQPVESERRRGVGGGGRLARPVVVAAGFLAVVAALVALDRVGVAVAALYVAVSLVSFGLYAADKSAAQRGARRRPESTLHVADLLGGWPGGLVARHAFRHKTRKQPFRTVFWCTVAANVAVLGWLVVTRPGGPA